MDGAGSPKALLTHPPCYCAGVIKVVFATGTLAAGINMPARSTVISAISRRVSSGHVMLKHNELLQMAGRAGRRGFDTKGTPYGSVSALGGRWMEGTHGPEDA